MVLLIIFIIPIVVYSIFQQMFELKTPAGASPSVFLLSVLVTKIGTSITFVCLFYLGREFFSSYWMLYGFIWWIMYVIGEIGQAIIPTYSWKEAITGIISETIYFPISAFIIYKLIGI